VTLWSVIFRWSFWLQSSLYLHISILLWILWSGGRNLTQEFGNKLPINKVSYPIRLWSSSTKVSRHHVTHHYTSASQGQFRCHLEISCVQIVVLFVRVSFAHYCCRSTSPLISLHFIFLIAVTFTPNDTSHVA